MTPRNPSPRYKPVEEGGLTNHIQEFVICAALIPSLIIILAAFGEQIDEFFSVWQRQLVFAFVLLSGIGVSWLIWKIKRM
jgi:hypothetical protein